MTLLWKLGGVALACLAAWFLVTSYAQARYNAGRADERTAWQAEAVKAERGKLAAFQEGLARGRVAETIYRESVRQLPPVMHRIIERSVQYAATQQGARECLAPERVRVLDDTRAALFPVAGPGASGGGAGALPADAAPDQPRRIDDQRPS